MKPPQKWKLELDAAGRGHVYRDGVEEQHICALVLDAGVGRATRLTVTYQNIAVEGDIETGEPS